jgi:hypothetical protein
MVWYLVKEFLLYIYFSILIYEAFLCEIIIHLFYFKWGNEESQFLNANVHCPNCREGSMLLLFYRSARWGTICVPTTVTEIPIRSAN